MPDKNPMMKGVKNTGIKFLKDEADENQYWSQTICFSNGILAQHKTTAKILRQRIRWSIPQNWYISPALFGTHDFSDSISFARKLDLAVAKFI